MISLNDDFSEWNIDLYLLSMMISNSNKNPTIKINFKNK